MQDELDKIKKQRRNLRVLVVILIIIIIILLLFHLLIYKSGKIGYNEQIIETGSDAEVPIIEVMRGRFEIR